MADRQTVEDDIAYLRQKEGMTAGKVSECQHLLELLGYPEPADAKKIVINALDDLVTDERIAHKIKALRVTLAVDPIFGPDDSRRASEPLFNLDQRQEEYAAVVPCNKTTVKNYESAAVKELIAYLKALKLQTWVNYLPDPLNEPEGFTLAAAGSFIFLIHGRVVSVEHSYTYENGAGESWQVRKRVPRPVSDEEFMSSPVARFVGLRLPPALDLLDYEVFVYCQSDPLPIKAKLERFNSLESVTMGGGEVVAEQEVVRAGEADFPENEVKLLDHNPLTGGLYLVSWEYENPRVV